MRLVRLTLGTAVMVGAALTIWITSPKPTAAVSNASVSPYELQLQTDVTNLPELKIVADLI